MARRRPRQPSRFAQEQLAGVRAWFDGVCDRCPEPILKDQRIVRHKNGYIHVTCMSGWDDE